MGEPTYADFREAARAWFPAEVTFVRGLTEEPLGILSITQQRVLASIDTPRYSSPMEREPGSRTSQPHFDPPLSEIKARQMGVLERASSHWDVLLETAKDAEVGAVRGRIHFISGNIHRLSGWIFLEWSEKEVEARFGSFAGSAQQLWDMLKSLGGE